MLSHRPSSHGEVSGMSSARVAKFLRSAALAGAAVGALLAGAACGGGDDSPSQETASDAIVRQLQLLSDGDAGALWDELHPAQQAFVPRDLYIRCADEQSIELSDIKALRERAEPSLAIAGTNLTVPATAVTVEFTFAGTKQTETFHEVDVDGRWRWVLSDPEPYVRGECP